MVCNWVFLDCRLYFAENIVSLLYVVFVLMSLLFLLLVAAGALGALMEARTESK